MASLNPSELRNPRPALGVGRASRPQQLAERIGSALTGACMTGITVLSLANFNELVLPPPLSPNLQQLASVLLWLVLIYASFLVRPIASIRMSAGVVLLWTFCCFAALSVLWANYSAASILKGLTLLLTTLGAYRLVLTVTTERIVLYVVHGLFILVAASLITVLIAPKIGVVQAWMHNGK